MTKQEWAEWFQPFRNGCKQYEKKKLDDSIELRLAVAQEDYQGAETIAIEIIGGTSRRERKNRLFDEFLD